MNRLFFFFLTLLSCLYLFTGCGSFIRPVIFPAHTNSYDINGEEITIKMLTTDDINDEFKKSYTCVFNENLEKNPFSFTSNKLPVKPIEPISIVRPKAIFPGATEIAATLLPIIINFAVENINKELDKEASFHETQFTKTIVGDKFYEKKDDKYILHYCGFEISRYTEKYPKSNKVPAFKLVLGIAPTADKTMFRVAPLSLEMRSSKAKVMAWKAWSFIPLFWWQLLFLNFDDEVKVSCNLVMNAIWIDNDNKINKKEHGAMNFDLPSFQFKETKHEDLGSESVGWFPHIPQSIYPIKETEKCQYWGNFELKIIITEKDPSHAKEYLEKVKETVEKTQSDVLEKIKKLKNLSKDEQEKILDQLKKAVDEKDVEKLWKIFEAI